ncbi:phosphonatase-like hydrolase [Agromyces sp. Marseille-Q5079]|uniref:phosphonatase-like hydrolase n=1 Tax=Agromyces sp. Marseille-Q5079 TaxID=3439059 RepID=UPI003D9C945E
MSTDHPNTASGVLADVDGLDALDVIERRDEDLESARGEAWDLDDDLEEDFLDEDDDEEDGEVLIELIVLDMAGTTVSDDGLVERAFALAAERSGIATGDEFDEALQYVRDTMGQSKIEVFTALADGDVAAAERANAEFEGAYAELVGVVGVAEIPGARTVIEQLRAAGASVALTTGFAPVTRDAIIDALGWHDVADVLLSPADAGRGRPAPDMALTALLRTRTDSVEAMVVVGDTVSDIESGVNAGAGLVVGVLTGAHDREALEAAGADEVIDHIGQLPMLLGLARVASVGLDRADSGTDGSE